MKLVTLKRGTKICCRCMSIIKKGKKGWVVTESRRLRTNRTRWYCLKCGDEMQYA